MRLPETKYERLYWSESKGRWQAIEEMPNGHLHNAVTKLRAAVDNEAAFSNDATTLACLEAELRARGTDSPERAEEK